MEFVTSTWDIPEVSLEWLRMNIERQFCDRTIEGFDDCGSCLDDTDFNILQRLKLLFTDGTEKMVVIKKETHSEGKITAAEMYQSEYNFYSQLASDCHADIPLCYYCSLAPDSCATSLLLESFDHFTSGDGVRDPCLYSLSAGQAHAAARELGKLHGSYAGKASLLTGKIQPVAAHIPLTSQAVWWPCFQSTWGEYIKRTCAAECTPVVMTVFEHCSKHLSNWIMLADMLGNPTLIHGDYTAHNLMFSAQGDEADRCVIQNFQSTYIGGDVARAADFMTLLVTSLDLFSREQLEDGLVDTYLTAYHTPPPAYCATALSPSGPASGSGMAPSVAGGGATGGGRDHGNGRCQCCPVGEASSQSRPVGLSGVPADISNRMPKAEFLMYCRMALQGLVYRVFQGTAMLTAAELVVSADRRQQRKDQLQGLVDRTCQAIIDYDLHSLLAVGR